VSLAGKFELSFYLEVRQHLAIELPSKKSRGQCPARNYRLNQFLLFSFLCRHGSSGEGTGRVARTAPPNMRAAKERRERPGVLPSAFLWIIALFALCLENMTFRQRLYAEAGKWTRTTQAENPCHRKRKKPTWRNPQGSPPRRLTL
jgi:hypothetical protein